MKRLLAIATLIVVSASLCAYGPATDLARAREIMRWVHEHVQYVRSPDLIKSPAATLLGGGDCADMSALMLWLLREEGIRAEMLLLDLDDFEEHHAVVLVYGKVFDPTTGREFSASFPLPHRVTDAFGISNLLADWEK